MVLHSKDLRIRNLFIGYDKQIFEWELFHFDLINKGIEVDEIIKSEIPLNKEWLIKFGFENWGKGKVYANEFEYYDRFVLHNVLDGTSNFELHYVKSTYGGSEHYEYIISCDEDDRLNWGNEIEHVHQLQNIYHSLTNQELKNKPMTPEQSKAKELTNKYTKQDMFYFANYIRNGISNLEYSLKSEEEHLQDWKEKNNAELFKVKEEINKL